MDRRAGKTRSGLTALIAVVLLVGCGEPRYPTMPTEQAQIDDRPMRVSVLRVLDAMHVPRPTQGSHLIEVEVLDGPAQYRGRKLTLPYDEWSVGAPPPDEGSQLSITPAAWVVPAKGSKGKPLKGWEKK